MEAKIINMRLYAAIEGETFSKRNITRLMKTYVTHTVLLWKDCKVCVRTTGIFTCSVSNSVTCFIGVPRVTGSVGSVACSGLLCLVAHRRLAVASLILAACFPLVSGRFIPVEIKIKS